MSKVIDEVEEDVTERIARLFELGGANPTILRIYMALFFANKPLGLKEISQKTGYSVSTVCSLMGIVENLFDVKTFKQPGSKKVYYECCYDILKVHHKNMMATRQKAQSIIEVLRETEERLKDEKDPEAAQLQGNISHMREDYEKFIGVFDKVSKMLHEMDNCQNGKA